MADSRFASSSPPMSPIPSSPASMYLDTDDTMDEDKQPFFLDRLDISQEQSTVACPKSVRFNTMPAIQHPFAGSSNSAGRPPPRSEKKPVLFRPSSPPPKKIKHKPIPRHSFTRKPFQNPQDRDEALWDKAVTASIDRSIQTVDLQECGVQIISSRVAELTRLVVLGLQEPEPEPQPKPFTRTVTAPAVLTHQSGGGLFPPRRSMQREKTSSQLPFGPQTSNNGRQNAILLLLGKNQISRLPRSLFEVTNLVVLSLRENALTEIPAAIRHLTRLEELNLSNNKLTTLPPEINELRLRTFTATINPFTPSPAEFTTQRKLGPLVHAFGPVAPLRELALRRVMSPYHLDGTGIALQDLYAFPVPRDSGIPEDTLAVMEVAIPNSTGVISSNAFDIMDSRCHNKAHGIKGAIFREACTKRLEWVGQIAGVDLSEPVPLEWRGCSWGCLDFLEETDHMDISEAGQAPLFQAGNDVNGQPIDLSDDED